MSDKRQKNQQLRLAFAASDRGEAPKNAGKGTEPPTATRTHENPVPAENLMEVVCERENLKKALKRVMQNKGGPGIDGMTVEQLPGHLREHWPTYRSQLLKGTYRPQPVKRVEIPKPGGGMRKLGIPIVLDRFVQQAVMQVLQEEWDRTFSEHSYGFRPKRSAHQAVARAQFYVAAGYRHVVDLDLEKFFDRVNHDKLMSQIAKRVADKRALRLIRAFLNAGVMYGGLVSPSDEGTPQGGPLSPLLSNIVLDELDRELERRGLRFVRYADDCNVYVASARAGQRVMGSIKAFITKKLKLTVNESKSAVARPWERKFLGFSLSNNRTPKRRIAPQAIERFEERIRTLTGRNRGVSLNRVVKEVSQYLTGWRAYFGYCETPSILRLLDSWLRRRIRAVVWRQWKTKQRRRVELVRLGVARAKAKYVAGSGRGPWRASCFPTVRLALSNAYLNSLGLPTLEPRSAT